MRKACKNEIFGLIRLIVSLSLPFFCFLFSNITAQDLPDEIRGYKVYKEKIPVETGIKPPRVRYDKMQVAVDFGKPKLARVTPLGTTFELSPDIIVYEQSGTIDFLTFRDFQVNGLNVEIAEYKESFQFVKERAVSLKKPIRIFVPASQTIKGGLKEVFNSKEEWEISGRVFVFGKFKKFGFNLKRVVPVDVKFTLKNPLK